MARVTGSLRTVDDFIRMVQMQARCPRCATTSELPAESYKPDDELTCPSCGAPIHLEPVRLLAAVAHVDESRTLAEIHARVGLLRSQTAGVVVVREEETPGWTEIIVSLQSATLRFRVDEREWTCSGQIPARAFESLQEPLSSIFPELRRLGERSGPGAQPR